MKSALKLAVAMMAVAGSAVAEPVDNIVVTARTIDFRPVYDARAANHMTILAKAAAREEVSLAAYDSFGIDTIVVTARTNDFRPTYEARARNYPDLLAEIAARTEKRFVADADFERLATTARNLLPVPSFELASN